MHLLTGSALLRALGWSLFNSLWQMSLLWAFYHLFLLVFKQLPARARHGLALLLLTAGFCWSAITFVTTYLFATGEPFPGVGQPGAADLFPGDGTGSTVLSARGFQEILEAGRHLAGEVLPWCSSLYLLILAGLLVHYCRQYLRSRRIVREGLSSLAPEFDAFVAKAGNQMGIRTGVSAYLSALVKVPVTLGFLKPIILLPVSMVTQLTPAQIEAILIHELAHIRRKDYLLNLLITGIDLLFFFNPFTRLLIAQLKKEREHCCDDAVLAFRYDPHGYVSALLSLARHQQQASLAVAANGGGGEQLLLQRARKILQQKRTDDLPGPRPLIGFLLTALVSMLLFGHTRFHHNDNAGNTTTRTRANRLIPAQLAQDQLFPGEFIPLEPVPVVGEQPVVRLEAVSLVIIHTAAARPLPIAPRTRTAQPRRHPARLHARRPSEDLLDAMLAESFPVFNTAGPATMPTPSFAELKETAHRTKRDFSMGKPNASPESNADPMAVDNQPFVPQSSFSFQYTDTLPPGEKLALMQELSQQTLLLQLVRTREELKQQEFLLRALEAAIHRAKAGEGRAEIDNTIDANSLQELLQQQLQLQQQYILNLKNLERQLQKAAHRLTIVYI
jgi:beta-lactamase regulating signal transducer with metallopeptidase domain